MATMTTRDRRDFLLQLGGFANTESRTPGRRGNPTATDARMMRQVAAVLQRQMSPEATITNGDEQLYPNLIATATKGLPHSQLGEVQLSAYQSLITAINSQKHSDAENIILGYGRKLVNLEAGFDYDFEGGYY